VDSLTSMASAYTRPQAHVPPPTSLLENTQLLDVVRLPNPNALTKPSDEHPVPMRVQLSTQNINHKIVIYLSEQGPQSSFLECANHLRNYCITERLSVVFSDSLIASTYT